MSLDEVIAFFGDSLFFAVFGDFDLELLVILASLVFLDLAGDFDGDLEGYLQSGKFAKNPLEINEKNLKEGEALYGMFCAHCHGPEGNGGGSIGHPIYSNIPHYNDKKQIRRTGKTMSELKAGHIFHSITYGVNAMGPHSSQLSEDERWKLVMHVQKLQKLE